MMAASKTRLRTVRLDGRAALWDCANWRLRSSISARRLSSDPCNIGLVGSSRISIALVNRLAFPLLFDNLFVVVHRRLLAEIRINDGDDKSPRHPRHQHTAHTRPP